jgi:uridine kinase
MLRVVDERTPAELPAELPVERPVELPVELSVEHAIEAILARAASGGPRVVVAVTGAVASGKTTLARRLVERFESRGDGSPAPRRGLVLSTDHYLPDYDRTPEHLRDMPESSDLVRLARDLAELRSGRSTTIPQWSFESHARVGEVSVDPVDLLVIEGLHALHELPRAHVDIAVYVEAPRDIRWERAMARERSGERPWPIEYLEHFFHNVAEPTFAMHAGRYRAAAHVVVTHRSEGAAKA